MAGGELRPFAGEILADAIGGATGDFKKFHRPSDLMMGDACLDKVAMAVQLVFYLQIVPAEARKMNLVVGEQVAVGGLGATQEGYKPID